MSDQLRALGDRMDNAQIGATRGFWNLCQKQEAADNPGAGKRVLTAQTGRRFTKLMFAMLVQDLTRDPGRFSELVAALANGVVRETGECLATFPFEERVRAYEGLSRQLAEGLGIGLAEAAEPESDEGAEWSSPDLERAACEAQQGYENPVAQVAFRAGFLLCREYMARFVEQGGDAPTAASIRANWIPTFGPDPGPPRKYDFAEITEAEDMENGPWRPKNPGPSVDAAVYALTVMQALAMVLPEPTPATAQAEG
jgi:hypothetical protein